MKTIYLSNRCVKQICGIHFSYFNYASFFPSAPFDPPSDIRVTNKSSTELEITWRPPPDDSTNGKLTGYNVIVNNFSFLHFAKQQESFYIYSNRRYIE